MRLTGGIRRVEITPMRGVARSTLVGRIPRMNSSTRRPKKANERRIVTDGGQPTCYTTGCRRDGEHRLRLTFDFSESTHTLEHSYCQEHAEVQFDSTSEIVDVEEISEPNPDILPVWDGGVTGTGRINHERTRETEVQR
jgi:hypothetical protein